MLLEGQPLPQSFADYNRFSFEETLSSFPIPAEEKHSHSMPHATVMFHVGDGVFRAMCGVWFLPHLEFCIKAKKFTFGLI